MEIIKHIKDSVKSTVGYAESEDKESFIIGTQVAFKRAEEFYTPIIKELTENAANWKSAWDTVDKDIRTLAEIIKNYTQQDTDF